MKNTRRCLREDWISISRLAALDPSNRVKTLLGFSTGAKAGIDVGIAVVVVLFCVRGFLLFRARHSKETKTFLKNDQPELVQAGPSEIAA
jgi:hypothetical protein